MGRSLQKRKTIILEKTDAIDIKAETMGMNSKNREGTRELENRLKFVIREEKFKWFQRSNTKYFHAKANGRKRKGAKSLPNTRGRGNRRTK